MVCRELVEELEKCAQGKEYSLVLSVTSSSNFVAKPLPEFFVWSGSEKLGRSHFKGQKCLSLIDRCQDVLALLDRAVRRAVERVKGCSVRNSWITLEVSSKEKQLSWVLDIDPQKREGSYTLEKILDGLLREEGLICEKLEVKLKQLGAKFSKEELETIEVAAFLEKVL